MKNIVKKLFAVLFAAVLTLTWILELQIGVLWNAQHEIAYAANIVAEGNCGAEGSILKWTLLDDGTLSITAQPGVDNKGEIKNAQPWSAYHDQIKEVIIGDGVTKIGELNFFECSNLTEITIPDSVTNIAEYAFVCDNLMHINVASTNQHYCAEDNILFSKDKSNLVLYPAGKQDTSYTIPDSVTSIGADAFRDCSSLTAITIPSSMTNVSSYAFRGCSGLTSLIIPKNVTSIGRGSFDGCNSLKTITILNSECIISSLSDDYPQSTVIHGYSGSTAQAYAEANGRTFVTITTPLIIDEGNCGENLTWALDDAGTLTISGRGDMPSWSSSFAVPWSAVCKKIKEVIIQDGVTSIGSNAFWGEDIE